MADGKKATGNKRRGKKKVAGKQTATNKADQEVLVSDDKKAEMNCDHVSFQSSNLPTISDY